MRGSVIKLVSNFAGAVKILLAYRQVRIIG